MGFLWAAVCILASLAVTAMAAILNVQYSGRSSGDMELLVRFSHGLYFMILMVWGFIVVNLLLISIYYKKLTEKNSRCSLVIFTFLNFFSAIAFTILALAPLEFDSDSINVFGYLNIFLVDFPVVLAVFTAFYWVISGGETNKMQLSLMQLMMMLIIPQNMKYKMMYNLLKAVILPNSI